MVGAWSSVYSMHVFGQDTVSSSDRDANDTLALPKTSPIMASRYQKEYPILHVMPAVVIA